MPKVHVSLFGSSVDEIPSAGGGGAVPLFRGGGSAQAGSSQIVITMSATAQAGDEIRAYVAIDNSAATITWPAGFTQQDQIVPTHGDGQKIARARKVAGGSEPSSYTITMPDTSDAVGIIGAWSGVNTTADDVTATQNASGVNGNSPFSVQAAALASGSANRLLIICGGIDNNLTGGSIVSTVPGATPATWTELFDVSTGGFANLGLCTCPDVAGTYTGAPAMTQTLASATGEWGVFLEALRAA